MTPTVSVVLPTYQRAILVEDVIRRLLEQPLQNLEVLVMDDGSSDDTSSRIETIKDPRVFYWNLGRIGVPGVINEGIERSSAPYILFMHDHDRFEPDLLVALTDVLDRNPSAAFAFCGYAFFDSLLETELEHWLLDLPELVDGREFLGKVLMPRLNCPVLALSMIRRSALLGGLMDTTVGGCADVELWHRLASTGDVAYVKRELIHVRGRDASSQFANPAANLELIFSIANVKSRFLTWIPEKDRRNMRRSWRRQIDQGAVYIAWKSLESSDRQALEATAKFVSDHGTLIGNWAFKVITLLPMPISRALLRAIRTAARRGRRSTV